ncbi:MAG: hypothetical protein E7313_03915 [Clostridiales bacterium]|nr:hypothetical protein [Clostridiales bacterium]
MKNKIFVGLAIIILIGIVIVSVFGFKVDICYKAYNIIDITIGKDFNIEDVRNITNEVFGKNKAEVQKSGLYNDNVVIKVDEFTDEQKTTLNTKINEKYQIENKIEDMEINYIPQYRLLDVIKPYLIPLVISTVIIFVYMIFRFKKVGITKVLSNTVLYLVMAELVYFAVIAITRLPINRVTMPIALVIYIAILAILNYKFDKNNSLESKEV